MKILFLLILTSCSFKSIVIPNITYLIADRIGNKLDLYYSQEKEFKQGIDNLIKEELVNLEKFNNHLKQVNIKDYDLKTNQEHYAVIYQSILLKANKLFAKPFSEFNETQVKKFLDSNKKQNEVILNRSRKDKTDEIAKRFIFFFDDISEKQRLMIKNNIHIFKSLNKKRYQNRIIVQNKMITYFSLKDKNKKFVLFNSLFEYNLKNNEKMSNLYPVMNFCTKFFKSLNPKQEKYFKKKQKMITEWISALIDYYQDKK